MSLNTFLLKYILGPGVTPSYPWNCVVTRLADTRRYQTLIVRSMGVSRSPIDSRRNPSSGHTPLPDAYCRLT